MAIRIPRLLLSRHGVYRFRYICPQQHYSIAPRKEISVSLRTRDPAQARIIALFLNHVIESKLANDIDKDLLQNLARLALPATLKIGRLTAEINNDWDRKLIETSLSDPKSELGKFMREAAQQEPLLKYDVEEILRKMEASLAEESSKQMPGPSVLKVRVPFLEAVNLYVDSIAHGNTPATIKDKRTKLENFHKWLIEQGGVLSPVYPHEVTGLHITRWVNHYGANGAKGRPIGSKTSASLYTILDEYFGHCVSAGLCPSNVVVQFNKAKSRAINKAKLQRKSYEAFQITDIQRIFRPDLYFTCMSQADMFFGPIIAIFTGARREEIAALKVSDFEQIEISDGSKIWVFRIRPSNGHPLKSRNSDRVVPVCEALVDAGLIDYVMHIKSLQRPNEAPLDLFPAREVCRGAKKGNKLGEKFSEYLTLIGVKTEVKTECFHSLRHTVITNFVALQVPPQTSMMIVGHLAQSDLVKVGYRVHDAKFAQSPHYEIYDSSSKVGCVPAHPLEAPKMAVDALNRQFKIEVEELGRYAKQVIELTFRRPNGKFESGRRRPGFAMLSKLFPDVVFTRVLRARQKHHAEFVEPEA